LRSAKSRRIATGNCCAITITASPNVESWVEFGIYPIGPDARSWMNQRETRRIDHENRTAPDFTATKIEFAIDR